MKLLDESFTLPPEMSALGGNGEKRGYPLYITAKRYHVQELEVLQQDPEAITLLAFHSTSFHKETWEPTLEALFDASVANGLDKVKIREVWAVDCPNHGHAGILNREMLKRKEFETFFGCEGYAIAVHHFLLAAPTCFGVDFSKKRLVGLGHSLGANGLLLLQALQPIFPFLSLIIVEPVVEPGDGHDLDALRQKLVGNAINRKSEWRSRDEAFLYLKEDSRTKRWDEKVMKAFVKHAIGESPSGTVTLACMPQQERIMYLDMPGATRPVGELTRLCPILPVHLIIGLSNDFIPRVVHDRLIDPTSGRTFASVSEVPQVGHLMPQEIPKKLGILVYELLTLVTKRPEKLRAMY
ncbi:hypothetical protein NP233_g2240 [Leucocoprinus birnbaumii]|uniref:AB hydrolase-1 domain-containing protein n=1 Tax=Leucocoprinus birnbaumii TaxID=56174 RepID=A0AAD5W143_9AGAR|nr:hypothetical protein NP233_g2240 [Leucocoprinus birnbaumii]